MKANDRVPIKISRDALGKLKEAAAFTARHGWAALGIDRDDTPTQTALMEAAVNLLVERIQESSK